MTNQELDEAFTKAQRKWLANNKGVGYSSIQQSYFFWAGSQFGVDVTKQIYNETLGKVETFVGSKSGEVGGGE